MKHKGIRPVEKTLLGVMVLIAGIIVAPMIRSFFQNAQQNKCLNNLYHVGQALRIYWDDYREHYPPFVDDHGGQYYTGGVTALIPYVKGNRVLRCPLDRRPLRVPGYSSYNLWDSDGDGKPETITYNAFGWLENGGTENRPEGWPSAAPPTADGKVQPDLRRAWQRIGYRPLQQPYLSNGNALPNTIVLTCPRHKHGNQPVVLLLRISGATEVAELKEVDFISQLSLSREK